MRSVNRIQRGARLVAMALGIALAVADRSEAQWAGGYGFGAGYGFGGWGFGGYGGYGSMGMSLYDQAMVKEQSYMNNAARYNLQNAWTAQAYQSANLMQQQAVHTALENQRLAYQSAKGRYDIRSREAASLQTARADALRVPLDQLFDPQGNVLWPDYAPSGGAHGERRAQADAAIRAAYLEARSSRASVGNIVEANRRLHDYGQPALDLLRSRGDTRTRAELVNFLNTLEVAINELGTSNEQGK